MAYLETLAERFVEGQEQEPTIRSAVEYVRSARESSFEGAASGPIAVQLAQSTRRWMGSSTDEDEDDQDATSGPRSIEKVARAHDFLSLVLKGLPAPFLQAREIKLFINFFSAMYELHDTNIAAVTEALTSLVTMDNYQPSLANDVLSGISSIDPDNLTKQLARTRLGILTLIEILLGDQSGRELQKRYKNNEHILKFLPLIGRERDPNNLLKWFRFLAPTLKTKDLSTEVADAVFDSISPFFPIAIRKSTITGPQITEQELKDALSSCFAANGQLAHRTFPFLLGKLDGGVSMTAAVKIDILRTIRACVDEYDNVNRDVQPFVPEIWKSLKYEVRNGESQEAIQETLLAFEATSRRLSDQSDPVSLKQFIDTIWDDCAEDFLDNPAYTEQLGSILVSVARVRLQAFRLTSPRVINAVKRAIAQPKSPAHTKIFLLTLNNLLRARRQVVPALSTTDSSETYGDEPVALLRELYFKVLQDNAVQDSDKQQGEICEEALRGLSQIAAQRRPSGDGREYTTDCDEDAFREICATLTYHTLNVFNVQPAPPGSARESIEASAVVALKDIVRYYPQGYGKMVSDMLDEVAKRDWTGFPAERSVDALRSSVMRLAFIGCTAIPEDSAGVINFAAFTGGMLKILGMLSTSQANFRVRTCVLKALGVGIFGSIEPVRTALKTFKESGQQQPSWSLASVETAVKDMLPTFPDLVKGDIDQFDPSQLTHLMSKEPTRKDAAFSVAFLRVGVFIVAQLYQYATIKEGITGLDLRGAMKVSPAQGSEAEGVWRDRYLRGAASVATTVLRELDVSAQMELNLHDQILACFHPLDPGSSQPDGWSYHLDDMISTLSWGVASAIRPEVVLKLHGGIYNLLMGDFSLLSRLQNGAKLDRAEVAMLLANKYNTRTLSSENDLSAWMRLLTQLEDILKNSATMASMSSENFFHVMSILRGAITRGDQFISKVLLEAISHAAVKSGRLPIARQCQIIFLSVGGGLHPGDPAHTVEKRLHKQRTYHQCVQPALESAYPLQPESVDSVISAVYILHTVKHLNLAQYEQDADKILRVALTAMQKADFADIDACFAIILHVMTENPRLIKDHIASIVATCKRVYVRFAATSSEASSHPQKIVLPTSQEGDEGSPDLWKTTTTDEPRPMPETDADRALLRKKSVILLQRLALELDELASRSLAEGVLLHMEIILGDQHRDIRQLARVAKEAWAKLLE